jgi:TolA-binding protein
MTRIQSIALVGIFIASVTMAGCVSVKAPERINVDRGRSHRGSTDTRSVPPTSSHEDARRKLAQAHAEIDELRDRNRRLEDKQSELKQDNDDCERRLDRCEDRYDD